MGENQLGNHCIDLMQAS